MSTRKIITFPDELLARITEWRRGQEDLPGESEAIRRLIEHGLEAQAETKKQEK